MHKDDAACGAALTELAAFLRIAQALDCPLVAHALGGRSGQFRDGDLARGVGWLRRAADAAGAAGVRLVLETHAHGPLETVAGIERVMRAVDHPNVGLIDDPSNLWGAGEEHGAGTVRRLGGWIWHVHVKDGRVFPPATPEGGPRWDHTLLGEGACDHVPVLEGLLAIGYSGALTCECRADLPSEERAAHDLRALRERVARAGGRARSGG